MAFFDLQVDAAGERFIPLPDAASRWTGTHLRGPAITALLARAAERVLAPHGGLRPVRATFDLHSPVPLEACRTEARVLKRGRTLALVETELLTGDRVLARCRAAFVAASEAGAPDDRAGAASGVWATKLPEECVPPNAEHLAAATDGRLYRSSMTGWTPSRVGHQNAERKLVWCLDVPAVTGEPVSPFMCAAIASDLGNWAINLGADGLAHINTDVTVSLSRLPAPGGVGVCSDVRSEHGGVAVGTAHLFDAHGPVGTTTVTAVRHARTTLEYGREE